MKIDLPSISTWTKPDLAHEEENVAVYLDGPEHDKSDQRQKDILLRNTLRGKGEGWEVIEIPIQEAENDELMSKFRKLINRAIQQ